jgi:hypothetical protein
MKNFLLQLRNIFYFRLLFPAIEPGGKSEIMIVASQLVTKFEK